MSSRDPDAYSVDLPELDDVIGDLGRLEGELEATVADLERQVRKLQEQWEGLAATAQREAHEEWTAGMSEMHTALGGMRRAGRVAHTNYTRAIEANRAMWSGLR